MYKRKKLWERKQAGYDDRIVDSGVDQDEKEGRLGVGTTEFKVQTSTHLPFFTHSKGRGNG